MSGDSPADCLVTFSAVLVLWALQSATVQQGHRWAAHGLPGRCPGEEGGVADFCTCHVLLVWLTNPWPTLSWPRKANIISNLTDIGCPTAKSKPKTAEAWEEPEDIGHPLLLWELLRDWVKEWCDPEARREVKGCGKMPLGTRHGTRKESAKRKSFLGSALQVWLEPPYQACSQRAADLHLPASISLEPISYNKYPFIHIHILLDLCLWWILTNTIHTLHRDSLLCGLFCLICITNMYNKYHCHACFFIF